MITVNTNATPALPVVNSPVTYCQNIIAIPLSATGNNLRWYNSSTGGLGSVIAPTPLTTVAGNYNYYVSQTNSGCEGPRALITVTVIATAPAPVVISPVTYCQNAVATALSATGSNLLWYSTATGGTSSTTNPTPVTTTPGNTFYYVSQTINGCEGPRVAITVTINVISTAVTGFQFNPDTVCTNANNTTPAYALGFTNGGVFSSTTGIVINPATGFVNLATSVPGTYNITYNYTTNGCINGNSSVSPLTINAAVPTVTIFSYNSPVCKNGINPTPSKATGFTNGGNYSSRPGLSINAGTGEINLANSIPGTYQVTYNLAMLGCRLATSNFSFITITDTSSPVTNFSYNKAIVCITETNPAITKATGFTSGGTFSATPAGLNIDAVTGAINIGLSLPGTYVVKYAVPSFICRLAGSSNFTFTINAFGNPVTGFSYASPICQNDTFKLPVKVTGFTAGGKFSSTTGLKIDSVTGIINPEQSNPGNYLIQYAVAAGTCNPAGAGSANVVIQTKPISPTVNNAAICGTGNISLNASASGTIKWYSDSTLQNLVNSGSSFYPLISTNTTYYLNNTVGTCISDKTPIIATVNPLPIAPYLGKDVSICKLDPLILNAGNYFSYQWQDGSTKPNFTVTASGTYKVIVGTAAGCKISSSINIIVFDNCEDIVFPSGFSPDGNGINDKFGPLPVENLIFIKDYHLQIFNRYGELVFNSINPYEKWDGLYRGKSSGTNNFVWIASYSFRNIPKISKGNILIVK